MFSRLGRDKRIIRRPNKSGDIYLSLFLTYIVFCKKNNYVGFAYFYMQDNYSPQHWCYTMHMERALASLYTGF